MSGATICICGGTFTMCEDGHAIDCPASNQFDRYKAMMDGPAACLTTPPGRSYADGVEDAARIVSQKAQAISTKLGRGKALDEVTLGIIAILTDAAADIRLLSQGGKA
jgi:hypothetical protein